MASRVRFVLKMNRKQMPTHLPEELYTSDKRKAKTQKTTQNQTKLCKIDVRARVCVYVGMRKTSTLDKTFHLHTRWFNVESEEGRRRVHVL